MNTAELLAHSVLDFYNRYGNETNGRYRSWEHCYEQFYNARNESHPDINNLSLQLGFYLASWGMYRGSSFLLQKDHTVHAPIVQEILKSKYDALVGLSCSELEKEEIQNTLSNLYNELSDHYDKIRKELDPEVKNNVSSTLITKVLLGTLACTPAYDTYFTVVVKDKHVTTANYNMRSLCKLGNFYKENYDQLEAARNELRVGKFIDDNNSEKLLYPQMKLLDLGFWIIGYEKCNGIKP